MSKFDERENSFEKKFQMDEELKFKISARANKHLGEWAAKALGIDDKVGSIEKGKMADIVIWDSDPFSVYAKTELVLIDGLIKYDSSDPNSPKPTDFELGIISPNENRL